MFSVLTSIAVDPRLIKIRSLTWSPLLICRVVGDLRKPHHGLHDDDPMYICANKWTWHLLDNMSMLLNSFACYEQSDSLKNDKIMFVVIYSWHKDIHLWPVMMFTLMFHEISIRAKRINVSPGKRINILFSKLVFESL